MEPSSLEASGSKAWAERLTASLHAQRTRAAEFLTDHQQRLERTEAFVAQELHRTEEALAAQQEETDRLRAERDALAANLAEARTVAGGVQTEAADAELQTNYEQALRDLRHARNQNAELQEQVAKARSTASKLAQQSRQSGRLDWEAEKQRILLALENDFDENDETQRREKLKIADVVRSTEEALASKDREIHELKQRLEVNVSPGAADAVLINNDAALSEERERLKRLQVQWSEKVGEAEVELALERAKLARQRAELEEQLRAGTEAAQAPDAAESNAYSTPTYRGRWLARLGLTDADREPRRVFDPQK